MIIFVFVVGLVIGSFLNCLIYRLETSQSFVSGRSFCPQCHHTLVWYDLVPVLSFLFLRGHCRYCQKPISWQYPLVEILTAAIFLLIFKYQVPIFNEFPIFNFQTITQSVYLLFIAACLIIIFVFDLKHYLIPDEIVYPGVVVAFTYRLLEVWKLGNWNLIRNLSLEIRNFEPLFNPLAAAFLPALFFWSIYRFSKGRAMGFGDIKLVFLLGLFLGFPNILVSLFFAFFSGAIIGVGLILLKKKTMKSELPFAPFLIGGAFVALFFGNQIFQTYIRFLS